ncbi:hypothetical protein EV561_10141 [Rhizobium sp. BK376]|nr:hypothetical protein EV561_10141 [Rhizobium sp. BK376]
MTNADVALDIILIALLTISIFYPKGPHAPA